MKIELKEIGKKYESRENYTLKDINTVIDDKDFCVILGPSGCGKTTLLRMIAGLNSVTEGELLFDGKRINEIPSKDRDIAMVFQSYALYPHMTIYQNMAFSLSMRKESKKLIHERVEQAAEILGITDNLYSKPSDVSGGQRQRVALGRAMVRKPKVFLMDEPLSNLDAKLREHMRIELVKLHKNLGTTTIYVTHDQVEAMTMATRIILMHNGKIQQVGKPAEIYSKPANIFVAKFIGAPSINLFNGKMENGLFVSESASMKVTPTKEQAEKLKDFEGKEVVLGIRSERLIDNKNTQDDTNILECKIDIIELLGKEKILHATMENGNNIYITRPGHLDYDVDTNYRFELELDALHFFDKETEDRIV